MTDYEENAYIALHIIHGLEKFFKGSIFKFVSNPANILNHYDLFYDSLTFFKLETNFLIIGDIRAST